MIAWLLLQTAVAAPPPLPVVSGYIDVGFFHTDGDGVSYIPDPNGALTGATEEMWPYYGDPWAATINTRGDVADLGGERNNLLRFDNIEAAGRPSFILNTANITVEHAAHRQASGLVSVDLEPRSGTLGSPGDALRVDLAYVSLLPFAKTNLRLYVGKVTGVVGQEYNERTAAQRYGITPSLMSRYTNGTPLGLKLRGSALGRVLWMSASLTNGFAHTERFGHLHDEVDSNAGKTGSARVALRSTGKVHAELGGSVSGGTPDELASGFGWMAGADLNLRFGEAELRADVLWVREPTDTTTGDMVKARGGQVEVRGMITPHFGPLVRVDWRDATLRAEPNFYASNTLRLTHGVRFQPIPALAIKAEYLLIREIGGLQLPNNVFTTSLVYRL